MSVSVDLPTTSCPGCGEMLDRAALIGEDRGPRPGDLTVCVTCSTPLVLDDALRSRALAPQEFAALPASAKFALASVQMAATRYRQEQQGRA